MHKLVALRGGWVGVMGCVCVLGGVVQSFTLYTSFIYLFGCVRVLVAARKILEGSLVIGHRFS